jgi:GTPase SAR1 family protein
MGKCVQLICGPAGSGKSTYVSALQEHCANGGRRIHVANLDPGADHFNYEVAFDIRDLVSVEDVMEELEYGPNGANIYCHEYLLENIDWLKDQMEQYDEDEYLVLDCAGQIELYTHLDIMRRFVNDLKLWGYQVVALFIVDATFVTDPAKFISGSLLSLSCMLQLELPHLNVLSKCDLVDEKELNAILAGSAWGWRISPTRLCRVGGGDFKRVRKWQTKDDCLAQDRLSVLHDKHPAPIQ